MRQGNGVAEVRPWACPWSLSPQRWFSGFPPERLKCTNSEAFLRPSTFGIPLPLRPYLCFIWTAPSKACLVLIN
jgi:hypothetical protein